MILDNEDQRQTLIALINASTFTGQDVEGVFKLKKSIQEAEIKDTEDQR